MLIELGPDFAGWDAASFWRDLKFDVEHPKTFGRLAIVGDERWEEWVAKASDLLFDAEIRFFGPDELARAESWALEGGSARIGGGT